MNIFPKRFPRRWLLLIAAGLILIPLRLYRFFVPWGADFLPFTLARVEGPELQSPDGATLHVYFNDAGAAHSGDHWTWVVHHHWLIGKRVVAEGYMDAGVATGDTSFPVEWNGSRSGQVDFYSGRVAFDF